MTLLIDSNYHFQKKHMLNFVSFKFLNKGMQGSNGLDQWKQYRVAKAYKNIIGSQPVHPAFRWIWQSSCQQKHKVFYWLLLKIG
jgi:hypothetical protein